MSASRARTNIGNRGMSLGDHAGINHFKFVRRFKRFLYLGV